MVGKHSALRRFFSSKRFNVFSFFIAVILIGASFLVLPGIWQGPEPLGFLDALFTATSAVCVTGLIVVDTAQFSLAGKTMILMLIQIGGLGVVSTVVLLILYGNGRGTSVAQRQVLGDYFLPQIEFNPRKVIFKILAYAFSFEILVALWLWGVFAQAGIENSLFVAIFHSVSAFCNAGFSTFPNNLENYVGNVAVVGPLVFLVIMGGLGFLVHDDLRRRLMGRSKHLSLHSKVVVMSTSLLLLGPWILFGVFEWEASLALQGNLDQAPSPGVKIWEAFVASVMPRTAGFDTIAPVNQSVPGSFLTMMLMFVGGGPGSTAGGLKITTLAVLVIAFFRGIEADAGLGFSRRRVAAKTVAQAAMLVVRMLFLVGLLVLLLVWVESLPGGSGAGLHVLSFETISAFSTVGLSMGVTAGLSPWGKIIIILAMYLGRIGILALALPRSNTKVEKSYRLPDEEVMLG